MYFTRVIYDSRVSLTRKLPILQLCKMFLRLATGQLELVIPTYFGLKQIQKFEKLSLLLMIIERCKSSLHFLRHRNFPLYVSTGHCAVCTTCFTINLD